MRKIVLAFLIILVSVSVSFGASTKVSELPETQTLTDSDIFLVSTYADGSYTSKYIAKQYLKTALGNMTTILNDTLWDAAGDLVYGTGANAGARLAIGAPYALLMTNSGASAPAWTSTLGATGTRLTKIWATDLEVTNAPTVNGAALTTILQPLDGELTALAGLTSAANAIPYFTGSGTAGVISSSANMVSLLESADYATALTNLGGQASDSALTSLSSKVFAKTALTGTGGLDTVLYDDIADGDIGMVGTIAGVIYWYVFEASSSTAESSPSVIAPDDAGANNGRWLLKLYCDGSSCSIAQGAVGGSSKWLEGSANGTDYMQLKADDDVGTNRKIVLSTSVTDAEDLSIQLGANDNTVTIGSSTSADSIIGLNSYSLGSAGVKLTGDGDGAITFLGLGNGYDEDLTLNLDDTENTASISSSTGVSSIGFGAIGLATTGTVSGGSLTPVIGDADDFDNNFTGANLYGGTYIVNAAGSVILANSTVGVNFTILLEAAVATVIEPLATGTDDTIVLNGTALTQGQSIQSSTKGAMCVIQYRAADSWMATCNGFIATP